MQFQDDSYEIYGVSIHLPDTISSLGVRVSMSMEVILEERMKFAKFNVRFNRFRSSSPEVSILRTS
jgi:hypothetical protein